MRRVNTIIPLALCTLLFISISSAQQTSATAATTSASVPNLIRYSGTLKDAQGAALASTSPVGVTFAIYNQQEGGAAVWQETQNVTPDANGQYSVVLGSTSAAGLPDDLFSQRDQRWLGVQIQGEAEQARVLLVSVPYAFKAHEADTLGGLPPSAFVKIPTAEEVSATTTNPLILTGTASAGGQVKTSVLPLANIPVVAGNPCPAQSLNPAVATLPIFTILGASDVVCDSVISQSGLASGANVGIGTKNPGATLDVNGAVNTNQYYEIGLIPALRVGSFSVYVGANAGPTTLTQAAETFVGFSAGNKSAAFANTYIGFDSGAINTTGHQNTYVGSFSGHNSTIGAQNTLIGDTAGGGDPGNRNVMLGFEVGINDFGGNDNVNIWNPGANESNTIRIGFPYSTTNCFGQYMPPCGQKNTYVAGIYNVSLSTGYQQVIIDSTGHLGSTTSTASGVTGMCGAPGSFLLTKWLTSTSLQCTNITELPGTFNVGINGVPNAAAQLDVVGGLGNVNATDTRSSYMIGYHPVLSINPYGNENLFVGSDTGSGGELNTFVGGEAGQTAVVNTSTFVGAQAGQGSTSVFSTFVGESAGQFSTGQENDFFGGVTGRLNSGTSNSFFGTNAGAFNAGDQNVFVGNSAGLTNTTGGQNTFVGVMAGEFNVGGASDIFVGFNAGSSNVGGSGNIEIGNVGVATDNGVIRIGNGQNATYIAGINSETNGTVGPVQEVCVGGDGKLWGQAPGSACMLSSGRFKEQITDIGESSSRLFQLRPVTFFYKPQYDDGSHLQQYGLIAEEVAKVYPELVAYDKDGQPLTVKYQMLAPMLLSELQKEHAVVMAQQDELQTQLQQIKAQQQQMQAQGQEIDGLKHELQLQNASLQQRLSKLESYVATQTQTKTASNIQPATAASPSGDSQ